MTRPGVREGLHASQLSLEDPVDLVQEHLGGRRADEVEGALAEPRHEIGAPCAEAVVVEHRDHVARRQELVGQEVVLERVQELELASNGISWLVAGSKLPSMAGTMTRSMSGARPRTCPTTACSPQNFSTPLLGAALSDRSVPSVRLTRNGVHGAHRRRGRPRR